MPTMDKEIKMNKKVLFNDGWEFAKSSLDITNSYNLEYEPVDIPHDWLIYDTLNLYENSIGWYKKKFLYNEKGKQLLLYFDGVYMDSSLYINGNLVGDWKYGYSSFEFNITEFICPGENEILLKVVHQSPNSRWYSGAGIYRNVWLKIRDENHIITDGIYITTQRKDKLWNVVVETEVNINKDVVITHSIYYGKKMVSKSSDKIINKGIKTIKNKQTLLLEEPLMWSPDNPELYKILTQLEIVNKDDGIAWETKQIESISQNIGFRDIEFDPTKGFKINNGSIKLYGVCEHHDLGALGAAFNKSALTRRFKLLKEMGVNAIRTAHNMPAPELMELADEMGFFVISEAFDIWEIPKTTYDYSRFFKDWVRKDVKSWVRRDRNHPSLIMWSIGNEIYDTHAGERGIEITRMLMELVLEHDPKRNARVTIGSNYLPWENTQKCVDILKVAGYNYGAKYYQNHHEKYPEWIIYGSETASVVQSRGVYHFPYEKPVLADDDEQCSALGNSKTSWGANSVEECIIQDRDTKFSLGQFIWSGFDYIGEPTPYFTKNSYFGQLDTATFKKDSYYIYQAEWIDYKKSPMVHIFPYWDFNEGQIIDIRICSNAPKIELQVNNTKVGTFSIDHENGQQLVGWWKVPYKAGEIKAIAYNNAGNIIATDIRKSFKEAKKICLNSDKKVINANGQDLIYLEISMLDIDGNIVENANNRVSINVSGEGRLIGLDNGDSTDYDSYKGLSKRLFNGKLMAVIAATLYPGEIEVEVKSKGIKEATTYFESLPVDKETVIGLTANTKNKDIPCNMGNSEEVPLRKIEILCKQGQLLSESLKEVDVEAKLFPENTSYKDIIWNAVNDMGIVSNIVKIEGTGLKAKVIGLSDGDFRIRCMSKNGSDKIKIISQLEFKATGLGVAYKNPYEFISAGLYDFSKGEIGNGNEKGIATSRDGESYVGFKNIDFGEYGTDKITIPIFALSDDEYYIQIWEGVPGEEGSEILADVVYHKEMKWNVYQEETYFLKKRIRGIKSICFVLNQKILIKGFLFEKKNKAFEKNLAIECDNIYGDSYKITETSVENIGNNVSLEFGNLDFNQYGTTKLMVFGRSPIDKNTIHIHFEGDNASSNQIIDFYRSEDYEERMFNIEKVSGVQKVTFIFLPGSNFDFGWFKFIE